MHRRDTLRVGRPRPAGGGVRRARGDVRRAGVVVAAMATTALIAPSASATVRPAGSVRRPYPPVVTRADLIADRLAHDPVFITDETPRDITPWAASRIRAAIHRMPAPTYAAIVTELDPEKDPQGTPERLIAVLHDKLRKNGVYLVMPSNGIGITAQQFGTNLPLVAASREVTYSQPYNAGPVRAIERFVDDIRSGQAQQRYEKVYAKSRTGRGPKPYRDAYGRIDLAQEAGAYSGMGLALLIGALVGVLRLRRRKR